MKKERITAYVDKNVKDKLEDGRENRTLSNHAADILTKHVSKNESLPGKGEKREHGK